MLYYKFNLTNEHREQLAKNDDSEFVSKVNSAIGEVNNKLEGKAYALVSSVIQGKAESFVAVRKYSITPSHQKPSVR